jgi:hypothetical protein
MQREMLQLQNNKAQLDQPGSKYLTNISLQRGFISK